MLTGVKWSARVKIPGLVTGKLKEMTELCPEVPTPNKNLQPCGFSDYAPCTNSTGTIHEPVRTQILQFRPWPRTPEAGWAHSMASLHTWEEPLHPRQPPGCTSNSQGLPETPGVWATPRPVTLKSGGQGHCFKLLGTSGFSKVENHCSHFFFIIIIPFLWCLRGEKAGRKLQWSFEDSFSLSGAGRRRDAPHWAVWNEKCDALLKMPELPQGWDPQPVVALYGFAFYSPSFSPVQI